MTDYKIILPESHHAAVTADIMHLEDGCLVFLNHVLDADVKRNRSTDLVAAFSKGHWISVKVSGDNGN